MKKYNLSSTETMDEYSEEEDYDTDYDSGEADKSVPEKEYPINPKYVVDPNTSVEITSRDLPSDLRIGELDSYLSQKYPNKYVYLFHSPITIFGTLPPEIIAKILKSEQQYVPTSTKISKNVRESSLATFMEVECQKPVTQKEVLDLIDEFDAMKEDIEGKILTAMIIDLIRKTEMSLRSMNIYWYETYWDEKNNKCK